LQKEIVVRGDRQTERHACEQLMRSGQNRKSPENRSEIGDQRASVRPIQQPARSKHFRIAAPELSGELL